MIKMGLILASLGLVAAIVLWPKSPTVARLPIAQSISIQELHMAAPLERLPVQQFVDQSLIYPGFPEQTK